MRLPRSARRSRSRSASSRARKARSSPGCACRASVATAPSRRAPSPTCPHAGFADQRDALAPVHDQIDALRCVQHLDQQREAEPQSRMASRVAVGVHWPASQVSRSASPTRLKPNTDEQDGEAGKHREPPAVRQVFGALRDHRAEVGRRRLHAEPEEGQDEAIRMTKPRSSVILVRIDGTQFGRISRNRTCARRGADHLGGEHIALFASLTGDVVDEPRVPGPPHGGDGDHAVGQRRLAARP